MGGVIGKIVKKAVGEPLKVLKVIPSKKEIEGQMRGQQPVKETVDAPEPPAPSEVVYAGQTEERAKKKKRKKTPTIATGSKGVIGGAPTEKTTLLGG